MVHTVHNNDHSLNGFNVSRFTPQTHIHTNTKYILVIYCVANDLSELKY